MKTAIALVIIAGWCWLIWSVNRVLKEPTVYAKQRRR